MEKSHRSDKSFFTLALMILVGLGCAVAQATTGPGSLTVTDAPIATPILLEPQDSPFSIYFQEPQDGSPRGGDDEALVTAIENAQVSIQAAIYDLDLWSLRDALIAAYERGVIVEIVTETELIGEEIQELEDEGIPVIDDRGNGLMHNKFMVIDGMEVWTGSMNFTVNGAYRNYNNLLQVQSREVAALYQAEFNEMFDDKLFGERSPASSGGQTVTINGVEVEVLFSPDDHPEEHIAAMIASANESISFIAFSFTSDPLSTAIISAAAAGVDVAGLMDAGQATSNTGGDYQAFIDAGIPVYLSTGDGKMHHKVLIIDHEIVVTGSYNFSRSAEVRNDENILIIYDPGLAAEFTAEFEALYAEAAP